MGSHADRCSVLVSARRRIGSRIAGSGCLGDIEARVSFIVRIYMSGC